MDKTVRKLFYNKLVKQYPGGITETGLWIKVPRVARGYFKPALQQLIKSGRIEKKGHRYFATKRQSKKN